jgi:hypothetical protein
MTTDPSWLNSTIAQSSAAIVAIIGGFITANVMSLTVEKNNLQKQLKDKQTTLDIYEESNVDMSSAHVKLTEADIPVLEERIKNFSYPPHFGWGFLTLGFLAISSIMLPIILIMYGIFSSLHKTLTVVLFIVGLGSVTTYIGTQIQELRRK